MKTMKTKRGGTGIRHDENLARLARVEGQVRGLRRMVEDGVYCVEILDQVQAARSALQSVGRRILRKHLEHCVAEAMRSGRAAVGKRKIEEVIAVLRRMERA